LNAITRLISVLLPEPDDPTRAVVLPEGVVNFCPGAGGSFGDALVAHPKTRFISFTGSKEVGLHITSSAAVKQPGQIWIKRVVLEMGGKDAIVVDADANIDAAVDAAVASAFGFQGQKCSACSRLILDEKIYDAFIEKLKAKVEKLTAERAAMQKDLDQLNNTINTTLASLEPLTKNLPELAQSLQQLGPALQQLSSLSTTLTEMNKSIQQMAKSLEKLPKQGALGVAILTAAEFLSEK
jgi:prefoldin subunit 5